MKNVWNLLLPQKEQCKSLCTWQIIFENPPEATIDRMSGYMLINPSRDVVASKHAIHIRSGKVR